MLTIITMVIMWNFGIMHVKWIINCKIINYSSRYPYVIDLAFERKWIQNFRRTSYHETQYVQFLWRQI